MHEVLVNRLGGLSLPRKSVVRLTDRPDMTLDVYRGRKTIQQQKKKSILRKNFRLLPIQCSAVTVITLSQNVTTGYKRVGKFSLPGETVHYIWLPPRLSVIFCLLPRLPSTKNGFLQRLSVCRKLFTQHSSLGRKQEITDRLSGSQI